MNILDQLNDLVDKIDYKWWENHNKTEGFTKTITGVGRGVCRYNDEKDYWYVYLETLDDNELHFSNKYFDNMMSAQCELFKCMNFEIKDTIKQLIKDLKE